jgi:hypothetical protein
MFLCRAAAAVKARAAHANRASDVACARARSLASDESVLT